MELADKHKDNKKTLTSPYPKSLKKKNVTSSTVKITGSTGGHRATHCTAKLCHMDHKLPTLQNHSCLSHYGIYSRYADYLEILSKLIISR